MRLLAVDGSNLHARAVHAAHRSNMHVGSVETGSLLLFVNLLSKYVKRERPTRVVVTWDLGGSDYRREVSADYKANRTVVEDGPPDTTSPRFLAQRFLYLSGIPQWEEQGIEADDLIAALWRRRQPRSEFIILSGDKDFLQLADCEQVWQIRPGVNPENWGRFTVRGELGCEPEHLPFYMALTGDKGDGVAGVPGIGPKRALDILTACHWEWERVLEHPKVEPHREAAEQALSLVGLREERAEVPEFEVGPFAPYGEGHEVLLRFLANYEMESVIERLRAQTLWR